MVNTMVQGCLRTVDDVLGKAGLVREDIDKVSGTKYAIVMQWQSLSCVDHSSLCLRI